METRMRGHSPSFFWYASRKWGPAGDGLPDLNIDFGGGERI